jgi:hypothetical protein
MSGITRPKRRILFVYGLRTAVKDDSLLRGNVFDWLRAERIPAQWSNIHRGWLVRTERVGDIVARAETAGIAVRMKGAYVQPEPDRVDDNNLVLTPPTTEVQVDGQLALLDEVGGLG